MHHFETENGMFLASCQGAKHPSRPIACSLTVHLLGTEPSLGRFWPLGRSAGPQIVLDIRQRHISV